MSEGFPLSEHQAWTLGAAPLPAARLAAVLGLTAWTAATLPLVPHPRFALHHWSRRVLRRLGVEVEVRGRLRHWPPLWVANHLSWLDPLVLFSLRPSGALAKGEVGSYPLIGTAVRRLDLAFVDRTDAVSRAASVVRLAADLRNAKPLLLFPEGTTTRGAGLAGLHEGGLRAAYRCGAAVQTLRISSGDPAYPWTGDDALLPHLVRLARNRATRVRLDAREVFEPRHFSSEAAWIDAIRRQLAPTL